MVTGCLFHTTALGLPRPLSAVKSTPATPVPTAASRPAPQGVLVGGGGAGGEGRGLAQGPGWKRRGAAPRDPSLSGSAAAAAGLYGIRGVPAVSSARFGAGSDAAPLPSDLVSSSSRRPSVTTTPSPASAL